MSPNNPLQGCRHAALDSGRGVGGKMAQDWRTIAGYKTNDHLQSVGSTSEEVREWICA